MKFKGLTLAETIIVVTIVGILAVMMLPAILEGYHNFQYATSFKKAVRTLNDTIALNISKGLKSAYYTNATTPLFYYLQKNLKVLSPSEKSSRDSKNSEFYTKDNIRYEFPRGDSASSEFSNIKLGTVPYKWTIKDSNCGTYGLGIGGSAKVQSAEPCIMLVDVNGDKGPNKLSETSLSDMFLLIVTDKNVLPYGDAAQKAYYEKDE